MANEISINTNVAQSTADDLDRILPFLPGAPSRAEFLRGLVMDYLYGRTRALNLIRPDPERKG